MTLRIDALENAKAKKNKGKRHSSFEQRRLESIIGTLPHSNVHFTTTEEDVTYLCSKLIQEGTDIAFLSGGDGTVHCFMTEHFKQMFRRYGKGSAPIQFAQALNRMALDPDSRVHLPAIYHRKRGTVNVYADTNRMRGDLETIANNIEHANTYHDKKGIRAFRRAYIPVMMLYDKERPNDLEHVQLMTLYADGLVYNFFQEYYRKKDMGGDSSMLEAVKVIARASLSVGMDKMVPRQGPAAMLYDERYMDRILKELKGKVKADNSTVIPEGGIRNATAMGTMGVSLYGIKPFHRMPRRPEGFRTYFPAGQHEIVSLLDPGRHSFHLLTGNPRPEEIVRKIPQLYLGLATGIPCITDRTARRVEIDQTENTRFIADGSRHADGKKVIVETAYLQPFILLDHLPMG